MKYGTCAHYNSTDIYMTDLENANVAKERILRVSKVFFGPFADLCNSRRKIGL